MENTKYLQQFDQKFSRKVTTWEIQKDNIKIDITETSLGGMKQNELAQNVFFYLAL